MPRKLIKDRKYHFIYKTTCNVTGKYYIGMHSTDNLEDGYLGSGKRLRYSVRKYGPENHSREILEFCKSREELINKETEIVNLNEIAKEECMNLMVGGSGGFINEETQHKRSVAGNKKHCDLLKSDEEYKKKFCKAISNGLIGKPKSEKQRNKHSLMMKGRKITWGDKIGKANKISQLGKRNSQYGTKWITKDNVTIKVKQIEVDVYLNNGWTLGRNKNFKNQIKGK